MSRLPNFVVIGAMRCGTTSLYAYLRAHPEVFMSPEKETDYFSLGELGPDEVPPGSARHRARTRYDYEWLFRAAGGARAVGEASPSYLFYPRSASRLHQAIPDAKLICILRDPIERAYSHYAFARKTGAEPLLDFGAAVAAEPGRWAREPGIRFAYTRASFYHDRLREFTRRFPGERIRIVLFQDFARDPARTMRGIYDFLDVDSRFTPDVGVRHNRSLLPRSAAVREAVNRPRRLRRLLQRNLPPRLASRIGDLVMRPPPALDPQVRAGLLPRFAEEVERLEVLCDRDLSAWRST